MEKKHFVKIVTSLVTVLLKMTLCLCIYFVFYAYLKLIHQTSPCISRILTCPLKLDVIRLRNLTLMNIFFTIIMDHSFFYNL